MNIGMINAEIKQYNFVVNDKYEGLPAPIHEKILELKRNHYTPI